MKCKGTMIKSFITAMTIGLFCVVSAQDARFSWSFDGGVSQPVGVYAYEYNTGFNGGTSWYYWPINTMGIGIRLSYDHWGTDESNIIASAVNQIGAPIVNPQVDGSANILGFVPSLRLGSGITRLPFNIEAQVGYGLYLLRTRAEVTGASTAGVPVSTIVGDNDWNARSGFQLRTTLGIAPSEYFKLNFVPMYNIVFHGAHQVQYFNGNLTFNFVF